MKKKVAKKLGLNKATISNLGNKELNNVKGGAPSIYNPCGTLLTICCMTSLDLPC